MASLGDGMRPGCHHDAGRLAKTTEYLTMGWQAKRALEIGVQRMIEGPGHIPLGQVSHNVRMIEELTGNAPLYLLGPLVTDIASGYDHIAAAIGGAVACMDGADFLCMVSPSEHLALPNVEEIVEGTRVCRIAAHIGDTVRKTGKDWSERELAMAMARKDLDWERQFKTALYGDVARRIHGRDGDMETCSMCGDLCAVKMVKELLRGEDQGINAIFAGTDRVSRWTGRYPAFFPGNPALQAGIEYPGITSFGWGQRWWPGFFLQPGTQPCGEKFSLLIVHSRRGRIASHSSLPSPVRKYSTLGGISAKASLPINPSLCRTARVSVSVLGLIPLSSLISPLNLSRWRFPSTWMMSSAHFLEMVSMTPSRGHTQN